MCFDVLKYYAHTQKNVRAVVLNNSREWQKTSKTITKVYLKNASDRCESRYRLTVATASRIESSVKLIMFSRKLSRKSR